MLQAQLKSEQYIAPAQFFLEQQQMLNDDISRQLLTDLSQNSVPLPDDSNQRNLLNVLACSGFIYLKLNDVHLIPCKESFRLSELPIVESGTWKLARFSFLHSEKGKIFARHPDSDCYLKFELGEAAAFLMQFGKACQVKSLVKTQAQQEWVSLFARAGIIQLCDNDDLSVDDSDPLRRQWDFHEVLFHSLSRLGRTDKPVGATWSYKGEIEQAPAVKNNPWSENAIALPVPNIMALMYMDMPLTMAMETRRSSRHNAIVPPSMAELGELLFRTLRVRHVQHTSDEVYASRPHPGGGGIYENEIYITINQCQDLPRGFYYYDPLHHTLCRISTPDHNMEALLQEAHMATAGICWPQILITIAARHTRFGWKYSGMGYAAQLKNIGVIYQSLYLAVTAMGMGGCALGLGNSDRFCDMTGLSWWEESSVGEFIFGRPL